MRRVLLAAGLLTGCGATSPSPTGPGPAPLFRGAYLFSVAPSPACQPGLGTASWSVTATTGADGMAVVIDPAGDLRASLLVVGQRVLGDVRAVGAGTVWIQSGALSGEVEGLAASARARSA